MPIDLHPPAPGTIVRPDTSRKTLGDQGVPNPRLKDPKDIPATADGLMPDEIARQREQRQLAGHSNPHQGPRTMAARKDIKEIADDPTFDASLAGTRARIEKAVALTSIVVLRHAEDGSHAADHFDQLAKLASTLKSLDATTPLDPAKLSDEQLADAAK